MLSLTLIKKHQRDCNFRNQYIQKLSTVKPDKHKIVYCICIGHSRLFWVSDHRQWWNVPLHNIKEILHHVFHCVTSPIVLTYCCVLHYFLTIQLAI